MTFKIIYIDEQEEDCEKFVDFVEKKDPQNQFRVECLPPEKTLDEMCNLILAHSPHALVTDFQLNEHIGELGYAVPYNGSELVESFSQIREEFPCFVITSFANDAAHSSNDVNLVYIKRVLNDSDTSDLNFLERIKIQIEHHHQKISNAEDRLGELLTLRDKKHLSIEQEEELIRLDTFLESSVDARESIPAELKTFSNTQQLSDLMAKVDQLLTEIKNEK